MNVDFADVKAIMCNSGTAMLGVGVSSGKNRAEEAAAVRHASSIAASWIVYDFSPEIELQCVSYLEDNCTAVLYLT